MPKNLLNRINSIFNDKKIRKTLLKLRLPLGIIAFVVIAFLIKPAWFFPGLVVSALGELAQVWCFSTIKTRKKLTVAGPYMFVRNPMYLSRFLLIFGILLMTGNPWIMLVFVILYYFYMVNRVRREEKDLFEMKRRFVKSTALFATNSPCGSGKAKIGPR